MTEKDLLTRLRALRGRAEGLGRTLPEDLAPFKHREQNKCFRTLPQSTNRPPNVTTTCTCLMALSMTGHVDDFYGKAGAANAMEAFRTVVGLDWTSSDLPEGNAFSKALILRAGGFLVSHAQASLAEIIELKHKDKSLAEIVTQLVQESPAALSVQDYPPTPTIGCWFADALDRLGINLSEEAGNKFVKWASSAFSQQLSLTSADHDAMMDPVQMAMAACLLLRIRRIVDRSPVGMRDVDRGPSYLELEHGVRILFNHQARSGIWPKYFPLFHYPTAGANFCFSFELLETLLTEFRDRRVFEEPTILEGLEKAVGWCEDNRLVYREKGVSYCGWNSGGSINSLINGLPESWATAVVHMFLHQLRQVLSHRIEAHLLKKYVASSVYPPRPLSRLIDSSIDLMGQPTTVMTVLKNEIISKVKASPKATRRDHRLSALLFGPPGTAKTSLVKALAKDLGWPFIEINPSHLLSDGLQNIHQRTNEIFADLMDLSNAVVLFDEMDALVRERGDLDVTREFLTTSMLPKLSELHERRTVLFFMATNHEKDFDEAIKRPGRFDILLFVGPPTCEQKLSKLEECWVGPRQDNDLETVREKLNEWVASGVGNLSQRLDLFMVGEFMGLLDSWRRGRSLLEAVGQPDGQPSFATAVETWSEQYITLREKDRDQPNKSRQEFDEDRTKSVLQ